MTTSQFIRRSTYTAVLLAMTLPAMGQSFKVQCPNSTPLHPEINGQPNPGIKCQQIAGTDGFATMGNGVPIYLFGFAPLSGFDLINQGLPGTQTAADFNTPYNAQTLPGIAIDPSTGLADTVNGIQADPEYNPNAPINTNGGVMNPATMVNLGVLAAQAPAPMMTIDEDDEFFLTLTNVGMIMRPDLFEEHTVHFHGYPNASSFFDGVPDVSVAISIAGSMTYYYTAPDAGTYFFHCHVTPPEHIQMGMEGQLYVKPRQNKVAAGQDLGAALLAANKKIIANTASGGDGFTCSDIFCTGQTPVPFGAAADGSTGVAQVAGAMYAYNDGDGSTRYDVEYPIMMMGFDSNFHFVSLTFNPDDFAGMKDKHFMLNGRSYPDTVNPDVISTQDSDGLIRPSQTERAKIIIDKTKGQNRALLRISNLSLTEMHTLATLGIPMTVIAKDARLLRDMAGENLYYNTNSITIGGGSTTDVILDATQIPAGTYFLYTTNLDHLSNENENFGGMMTEIAVIE